MTLRSSSQNQSANSAIFSSHERKFDRTQARHLNRSLARNRVVAISRSNRADVLPPRATGQHVTLFSKQRLDPIDDRAHANRAAQIAVHDDPVFGGDLR